MVVRLWGLSRWECWYGPEGRGPEDDGALKWTGVLRVLGRVLRSWRGAGANIYLTVTMATEPGWVETAWVAVMAPVVMRSAEMPALVRMSRTAL